MQTHPGKVRDWLQSLAPDQRERAERLAALIRSAASDVSEDVKWGRLTFTADDDWHHWLCSVAVAKQDVTVTFHKGVLLDDPHGVLTGDAAYVRHMSFDAAIADPDAVTALVREAVAHQTDMVD